VGDGECEINFKEEILADLAVFGENPPN